MSTHPYRAAGTRRLLLGTAAAGAAALLLAACASPSPAPSTSAAPAATRPPAPEGELSPETQEQLQAALDGVMSEYDVTGAAAGVWVPGEGSWTTASGIADLETGLEASTDMQWPLRSVTKSYTVTLLLELVDEGVVSLDDTIDQYVEGVTDGDQITLRELANMSSGNADYVNDDFIASFSQDPDQIYTLDDLNGFMLGKPAEFAPGTEYIYTNANTNLLGAVVESATGQDFADVLNERILEPLGQSGTQYIVDVSTWTDPHPVGYRLIDGEQVPQPDNLSIYGSAGSMISTLDDGRVWAETLATGALLTPETQQERLVGAKIPRPPYDQYALGIGETNGWWGHNGEGFGFTAAVFHNPDTGASIVVYMNASDTPNKDHPADLAFRALADVLENGAN